MKIDAGLQEYSKGKHGMPHRLGVNVGDKFYLNDVPVTIRSFAGYYAATVEVNGKTFDLSVEEPVEIYPNVRVSCAQPKSGKVERFRALHQLIIDAGDSIEIPVVHSFCERRRYPRRQHFGSLRNLAQR